MFVGADASTTSFKEVQRGPFTCIKCLYGMVPGAQLLRELSTAMFMSLAPATLALEVQDLHHEVRLGMLVILVYNMSIWAGSWGT